MCLCVCVGRPAGRQADACTSVYIESTCMYVCACILFACSNIVAKGAVALMTRFLWPLCKSALLRQTQPPGTAGCCLALTFSLKENPQAAVGLGFRRVFRYFGCQNPKP